MARRYESIRELDDEKNGGKRETKMTIEKYMIPPPFWKLGASIEEYYKRGFFSLEWNGVFVLFPNILYISCWKREEEVHNPTSTSYSFPTSCTFLVGKGRKGTLEDTTQLYKHFENTRERSLQTRIFWIGTMLSYYFPTSCTFLVGGGRGLHSYTNTSKGEEGASFWIGTAPLYLSNVPSLGKVEWSGTFP